MNNTPRFCENCGASLTQGVNFCEACGHPVETTPVQSGEESQPSASQAYNIDDPIKVKPPIKKGKSVPLLWVAAIAVIVFLVGAIILIPMLNLTPTPPDTKTSIPTPANIRTPIAIITSSTPAPTITQTYAEKVYMGSTRIAQGGTEIIPIQVTDVTTDIAAAQFTLTYNPAVVTVSAVNAGSLGTPTSNINNVAGSATIAVVSGTGATGTVTLSNVVLQGTVGANSGVSSPLEITEIELSDSDGAIRNLGSMDITNGFATIKGTPTPTIVTAAITGTVTRSFSSANVLSGETVTVTLTLWPAAKFAFYQVIETIPAGFTVTAYTADSSTNVGNVYTFTNIGSAAFTYTLTAPAAAVVGTFSGTFKDENKDTGTVGGATTVTVAAASAGATFPIKVILDTWNKASVDNNPSCTPSFTISEPQMITYIDTYHWNYGKGTEAGCTITLKKDDGTKYGPWQVETKSGMNSVPNAWWITHPNVVIPAGTYTVEDSDTTTWSQNSGSKGCGFSKVEGKVGT